MFLAKLTTFQNSVHCLCSNGHKTFNKVLEWPPQPVRHNVGSVGFQQDGVATGYGTGTAMNTDAIEPICLANFGEAYV